MKINIIDKVNDGLLGFVVGDALGVPIEFTTRESHKKEPLKDMIGFGSHNVSEGTWSDDSSMTIATMDSIRECKEINYDNIMQKFCDWLFKEKYTATDIVFDIGNTTLIALNSYYKNKTLAIDSGMKDEYSNGNGSLMRMLPIVYYLYCKDFDDAKKVQIINDYSSLTHGHEVSKLGCKIYYDFLEEILNGLSKIEAYKKLKNKNYSNFYSQESISKYKRVLDGSLELLSEEYIKSSGYVIDTLEASIWSVLNTADYEEAVIKAVNLGGDTDTIGAITGSIAGNIYGANSIPKRWISKIKKLNYIQEIALEFAKII